MLSCTFFKAADGCAVHRLLSLKFERISLQVQANGHHASDAPSLPTRVTAPPRMGSRDVQDASSSASLASASSMLTAGSTAQHMQLPPKPVQVHIVSCQPLSDMHQAA